MKKTKNKEIIFLIKLMAGGGAERVISLLSRASIERGHPVTVILTHQPKSAAMLDSIDKNITVISLYDEASNQKTSSFLPSLIMLFARLLGKLGFEEKSAFFKYRSRNYNSVKWLKNHFKVHTNPTVVAFHNDPMFLSLLAKTKTTRVIISERGDPAQFTANKTVAAFMKNEFPKADGVVFQSPDAQKWYLENTPAKGTVIFNPVKSDLPEPYCGKRKKRIVNFCRISTQKNLLMLVDAFAKFHKDFSDYELDIIGDAVGNGAEGYVEAVNEQIRKSGCENCIHILPSRRDIHEYIKDYAMFVSSSDFEGMSNSMLEAMALGLPVICTDCPAGGARAVIRNGENGILTPVGDANALYLAMKNLAENPEFAETLGKNATKIRTEQSVEKIIEKWMKLITE